MEIEEKIFVKMRPCFESFEKNGFNKTKSGFVFERDFMSGDFRAVIKISKDGIIKGKVLDNMTNEEYLPLRIESRNGVFVNTVRNEYEKILLEIAENCFTKVLFCSDQANRISEMIFHRYHDKPDFPWKDNVYSACGVFRHQVSRKWYALIMNVKKTVLEKTDNLALKVDIINLKADCKKIDELFQKDGVYPAYHMNHKTWISVVLDETVPDKQVMEYINESYLLTENRKKTQI